MLLKRSTRQLLLLLMVFLLQQSNCAANRTDIYETTSDCKRLHVTKYLLMSPVRGVYKTVDFIKNY